jgi:hypothetical protein
MQEPLRSYNIAAVVLIVGGVPIHNYGEDGGVTFTDASAAVETMVAADGPVVVSATNDFRMDVEISVSAMGRTNRLLQNLYAAQQQEIARGGLMAPVSLHCYDPSNGDTISSEYLVFIQKPGMEKNKKPGVSVWKLQLPYARDNIRLATQV